MTEQSPAARVTAALGALDLKFERTSAPNGSPLWTVPFAVEDQKIVVVTLYLAAEWVVALHLVGEHAVPAAAMKLLEMNARLLGAKIALMDDTRLVVLADLSLSALTASSLWLTLQATVAAARMVAEALQGASASA